MLTEARQQVEQLAEQLEHSNAALEKAGAAANMYESQPAPASERSSPADARLLAQVHQVQQLGATLQAAIAQHEAAAAAAAGAEAGTVGVLGCEVEAVRAQLRAVQVQAKQASEAGQLVHEGASPREGAVGAGDAAGTQDGAAENGWAGWDSWGDEEQHSSPEEQQQREEGQHPLQNGHAGDELQAAEQAEGHTTVSAAQREAWELRAQLEHAQQQASQMSEHVEALSAEVSTLQVGRDAR